MKKHTKIDMNDYFEIKAGLDGCGVSLTLNIPNKLYHQFEQSFATEAGEKMLNDFYFTYMTLTEKQKTIFQFSIYEASDEIRSVADLCIMLKAFCTYCSERD